MSAQVNHPTSAVLSSGGLDSAVLIADRAQHGEVQPIYVACGLAWEGVEQELLTKFLGAYHTKHRILPLARLELSVLDIYPTTHWAIRGVPPDYNSPDSEVYLAGRNIILLAKAAVLCASAHIGVIAMGQLKGNPFPDATPTFFSSMAHALSLGLEHPLEIVYPFLHLKKSDVIAHGAELGVPFELTMSCMNPKNFRHCGRCNKCRERKEAFAASRVEDVTPYDSAP